MREALQTLIGGGSLDEAASQSVFQTILSGDADDAQIGALLALIQQRGPTVDELVGAARVMREHVTRVPVEDEGLKVIDTCGTGGAPKTFNVSTSAAIVAAAAGYEQGLRVAKHGNRSRTGRGSAEALAQLGVNVDAPPEVQSRCLADVGVCFCFAIHHHPATKYAIGPRKALGFPTMYNLLGPLTNPAGASRQLIGVWDAQFVELLANALVRLGAEHAMVVHSDDGLDEISISAPTMVAHVANRKVTMDTIDMRQHGVERAMLEDLQASTLQEAADLVRSTVAGEPGPPTEFVIANAAGALIVADVAGDFSTGVDMARAAIESGEATRTLERLVEVSNS